MFFPGTVQGMTRSEVVRRVRAECGEWALEAVVAEVGQKEAMRSVCEGLVRAEDTLELDVQTDARRAARARLRDIRRGVEVELWP